MQMRDQPFRERPAALVSDLECARDRRKDQRGVVEQIERHEDHTVRELTGDGGGGLNREPRLANAAGSGQRHQRDIVAQQQGADRGHFLLAADQRGAR